MPHRLPEPSADAVAHSARVVAHIHAQIEAAGGWIGFDRYMELALYAPGLGYYAAGARKFGDAAAGGDFVTAPEISPYFAATLARQVAPLLEHTAPQIVEFGAGSGLLARDLLRSLESIGAAVERYAIVEVSAELRARQQALLAGQPVVWLDHAPGGPDGEPFDGVIVANEVLDVMPVRLFARRHGATLERGVAVQDGAFVFSDRPADAALAATVDAIERETGPLPDGYVSEVGDVARAWSASLADWLGRGVALLIDYGFPRREYYHPQRLMGTLMCHYRHHAHADPFRWPGLTDITAHVDFSAVAEAAHEAGLDVLGYTSQAHFLLNCGILDLLRERHPPVRHDTAGVQRLLSEAEMGELFKVLAVGRGVETPLAGFARGDRRHML